MFLEPDYGCSVEDENMQVCSVFCLTTHKHCSKLTSPGFQWRSFQSPTTYLCNEAVWSPGLLHAGTASCFTIAQSASRWILTLLWPHRRPMFSKKGIFLWAGHRIPRLAISQQIVFLIHAFITRTFAKDSKCGLTYIKNSHMALSLWIPLVSYANSIIFKTPAI